VDPINAVARPKPVMDFILRKYQGSSDQVTRSLRLSLMCGDGGESSLQLPGLVHETFSFNCHRTVSSDSHQPEPQAAFPRLFPAHLNAIKEILPTQPLLRLQVIGRH
jgi:hypothetical protein